jgi:hypothetical protein
MIADRAKRLSIALAQDEKGMIEKECSAGEGLGYL